MAVAIPASFIIEMHQKEIFPFQLVDDQVAVGPAGCIRPQEITQGRATGSASLQLAPVEVKPRVRWRFSTADQRNL
jgi:hypothetical protein